MSYVNLFLIFNIHRLDLKTKQIQQDSIYYLRLSEDHCHVPRHYV